MTNNCVVNNGVVNIRLRVRKADITMISHFGKLLNTLFDEYHMMSIT